MPVPLRALADRRRWRGWLPRLPGRPARLRVGVPEPLAGARRGSGHGTVWWWALRELSRRARLRFVAVQAHDGALHPRGGRRADVWLADGHAGPLRVDAPVVVEVHEIGWHDPHLRALLDPGFAAAIERDTTAGVAAAERVIALSHASAAQVVAACGAPSDRVHAVHPGVDGRRFRPGLRGGLRLAMAGGLDEPRPYVLFVGTLHPRKNLRAVRAAVAGLARRGLPHALVVVAAPAPDRADSTALVEEATAELPGAPGRLAVLAPLSEPRLAAVMAGADALCLPSFSEGFGLTALEAMACGTPVVVSDRGALPEVVGDAGLVVEPDAEAVEEALARVVSDPLLGERLSRAGLARAQGFTWGRTAAGWLSVLERAAAG